MNARQMKKHLKKQIDKIQSDNRLMRNIINDCPTMQELYDAYNKPLNITKCPLQEFRMKRMIPVLMENDREIVEHIKLEVAKDLFEVVKDNISYRFDNENGITFITGSIFTVESEVEE